MKIFYRSSTFMPCAISTLAFFIMVYEKLEAKRGDFVILQSVNQDVMPKVSGNKKQLTRMVSPASTFKIIISWAGIEEGKVSATTLHRVKDGHVPDTPREINLHEAMYYSSNDYFTWLSRKIGEAELATYIRKSNISATEIADDWLKGKWQDAKKGGDLKVNAEAQHRFIKEMMRGQITSSPAVHQQVLKVMEWPSAIKGTRVFGKTGVWGGAVWFNGFGIKEGQSKAVTVLYEGSIAERHGAIAAFYRQFEMQPLAPSEGFFE
ncbi:MAG: penicillin-binding transpeptidase domain-containing protein [Verrucomicrobiota bacterium]